MSHSTRMYAWEGTTINGNKINGRTEGRSQAFVRAELQRQGIRAACVRPASRVQWRWPAGRDKADAAGFSRQLATLLRAGVPLLQAFEVMGRSGGDEHLGRLLTQLQQDVGAGLAWPMRCSVTRGGSTGCIATRCGWVSSPARWIGSSSNSPTCWSGAGRCSGGCARRCCIRCCCC